MSNFHPKSPLVNTIAPVFHLTEPAFNPVYLTWPGNGWELGSVILMTPQAVLRAPIKDRSLKIEVTHLFLMKFDQTE